MSAPDTSTPLRAAVARAFVTTTTTRLVTIDAVDLVVAHGIAMHVALVAAGEASPGTARADPLRLPLIEGVADAVIVRDALGPGVEARLREVWRILAPAGVVVLVVALPRRRSPWSLVVRRQRTGRVGNILAASMFSLDTVTVTSRAMVARAVKADGLAPVRRQTAAVSRPVRA